MSPAGDDRPPRAARGSEGGEASPRSPRSPASPGGPARAKPARSPSTRSTAAAAGRRSRSPRRPTARSPQQRREGSSQGEAAVPGLPLPPQPARPVPQAQPARASRTGGDRGRLARAPPALVGGKRPWLRWVLIVAVGWLLLSFITFAISAQIQKGKLPQSAKDALKGGPAVLAGQNILILGGDRRGKTQHNANGTEGQGPAARRHDHGPARLADLVPQALDPPRQLRGDPGLRRAEDQRLPRLQHPQHQRQPRLDHQDRRELPRHRHQPHRDRRLRRLRRASSTRSAG